MKIIHSILRYRIFEIIGVLCLIVSLSLIGLILFKDEGLEDLNSQIELKTSDSNANKITNNTKNLVPESDNKIIKDSSKEILNDNDLIDGEDFDEVDLYWLLNGKGTFPKSNTTVQSSSPPRPQSSFSDFDTSPTQDLFSDAEHHSRAIENHITPKPSNIKSNAIAKIIVLYTDGSFEAFEN